MVMIVMVTASASASAQTAVDWNMHRCRSREIRLSTEPLAQRATDENKFGRKLNHFIDNEDVMAK